MTIKEARAPEVSRSVGDGYYLICQTYRHGLNITESLRGTHLTPGPGCSVGIATGYGLEGPGIESGGGEIFRTRPHRPWGPPCLLYNGYRVFPGGKERPGRDTDPSLPSSPVVKKG
jgi:hypothetical protein